MIVSATMLTGHGYFSWRFGRLELAMATPLVFR
jgi:hypothetical protein